MFNIPLSQLDRDQLDDLVEAIQQFHMEAELLALKLEKLESKADVQRAIYLLFDGLSTKASQLGIVGLSEGLDNCTRIFKKIWTWGYYSTPMVEMLLMVLDHFESLLSDIVVYGIIDGDKLQQLLVPLQRILQAEEESVLTKEIDEAIILLSWQLQSKTEQENSAQDIVLFDDDCEEEHISSEDEDKSKEEKYASVIIDIHSLNKNPLEEAREYIRDAFANDSTLTVLSDLSDQASMHSRSHVHSMLEIAIAINILAKEPVPLADLLLGGVIHDVGLARYSHLLTGNKMLSEEEQELVRMHPIDGAKVTEKFSCAEETKNIVMQHHEKLNGKGYPFGLKKGQISDAAQIVAIADTFDGTVHDRPYSYFAKAISEGIAKVNGGSGTEFNPHFVKHFNDTLRLFWLPERHVEKKVSPSTSVSRSSIF